MKDHPGKICRMWGVWVVRVGGDDGELRPWHYIYEVRRGRWGTLTMALHIRTGVGHLHAAVAVKLQAVKLLALGLLHLPCERSRI